MAYNPFNIFRRNQKALFAVLTVFVMVVFTLSSGVAGGDFFDTVSRWLGSRTGRGEVVCKIDGHKVTAGELEGGARSLQFRRVMANRFMYYAAQQSMGELLATASQQRERLSPQGQQMADSARRAFTAMNQLSDPQLLSNPQIAEFFLSQVRTQIIQAEQEIESTILSSVSRTEDKEVARMYRAAFNLRKLLTAGLGEHYFVNAPNKTRRDLIEFMLWEKKADQLGIRFTRSDVNKMIQADFANAFRSDVEVRKILSQTQGFTMDTCLDALASEFKVRAAQTAILGNDGRYHGAPAYGTPYEMFEYYREQTSPASYEVLAIPAIAFLDKVQGEPTEAEISELFKKYSSAEPNPKSETPGFKTPRMVSVAYLGITGEEPYYKKIAEEQVKVGEVMAKASGLLTVPLPGAIETWVAGAAAPMSLKEPAVDAAYNRYSEEFKFERDVKYMSGSIVARDLLPSSTLRPGVVAATLGGMVGQTAGFGNPIAATSLAMGAPISYEIRDRVKAGMPLVLGGIPGPALLQTAIGGAVATRTLEPKPLPIEAMRPELIKTTVEKRAKTLAFGERPNFNDSQQTKTLEKGDVTRFIEELAKLNENGKPKDKAASDKYIKDFITTRGLTHSGASTAPRDEWTLEEDPGLQALVFAQKDSLRMARGAHGKGGDYLPFGRSFFWKMERDFMGGGGWRRGPATTNTYEAQTYPPGDPTSRDDGRPHYVVWRTEDVASKPTNIVTARPAVIAAWKRLKARELAQARANAIAEMIRANANTDPALVNQILNEQMFNLQLEIKDPKAAMRTRKFPIDGVAPLTQGSASPFGGPSSLQLFSLAESDDIPYPTVEFVTALVENRTKPAKTVLVLPDAPKDTFYVATLMNRRLKDPMEFKLDVYSRTGGAQSIARMFRDESVNKSRQSVLELLKKEFKYEETEEQKKKLDENAKSGGRNTD